MLPVRCCDWRQGEWQAALGALLGARQAVPQLQAELADYYQQDVRLLNSARAGIRLLLQHWQQQKPARRTVLYPAYICDSVPKLISQLGLHGVPAPVNAELNLCDQQLPLLLTDQVLAVIAPHMYGAPAPMAALEKLCRQADVFLLDDAAQICGVHVDGRPLGTFGDGGVLSFAQAKTLVSGVRGSGGALIGKQLPALVIPAPRSGWSRLAALWHFYASYQQQGWAGRLDYWQQRLWQKLGRQPADSYAATLGISTLDAAIVLRQWQSLPERQQQLRQQAQQLAQLSPQLSAFCFPQLQPDRVLTRLMLQSRQVPPARLQQELATLGIASKKAYGNGSQPYTGTAASGLLELPWQALQPAEFSQLLSALVQLDQRCAALIG